jgi:hypothetical protein
MTRSPFWLGFGIHMGADNLAALLGLLLFARSCQEEAGLARGH